MSIEQGIQLTAYACMFNEMFNKDIKDIVVIGVSEDGGQWAIRKEIKTLHEDKGNDLAKKMIEQLREKTYRKMSDLELDSFSVDMIDHFLDNFEAKAYVKRKLDNEIN